MPFIALVPPIYLNVKSYGAAGDGVTDDTTAIANARSAANTAGGGTVFYPAGTYISGNQTIYNNVVDAGAGVGATTIMLKAAANTDLFSAGVASINMSSSFGVGSTGGVYRWEIRDMTLHGNKAAQTAGPSWVVRVYGYTYRIENVIIRDGYSGGCQSDWNGGGSPAAPNVDCSSTFIKVEFYNNGGFGMQIGGPHDTRFSQCNSYDNGNAGFHFAPNSGVCKVDNCHSWGGPLTVHAASILIESGAMFSNCAAEGSDVCQVAMLSSNCVWSGGMVFANPAGNVIGIQYGQVAGVTPYLGCISQSAGVTTAANVSGCYVNTSIQNCQTAAIDLVNVSGNLSIIQAKQASGTAILPTYPNNTETIILSVTGGLTSDGTLGKSGGIQLNTSGYSGLLIYNGVGGQSFNFNAPSAILGIGNAGSIRGYSDAYFSVQTIEMDAATGNLITGGALSTGQSAAAAVLATAGTITVGNIGVARVAPAAAVTGVILQVGTRAGQQVTVVNESAFAITFAVVATSHVADGVSDVIVANAARTYVWDSITARWYPCK